MTNRYEIRRFRDVLEVEDDEEVVVGSLTTKQNGEHVVLVEVPPEGIESICGYETDNGECQRSVDSGYCWQHSD